MFFVNLIVAVPDIFQLVSRNAFPKVLYFCAYFIILLLYTYNDVLVFPGVVDGIDHEVIEDLLHALLVRIDNRTFFNLLLNDKAILILVDIVFAHLNLNHCAQIEVFLLQNDLVFLQL